MRVLIYEYITGGGLLGADAFQLESLRAEGEAMLAAVVAEFLELPGTDVHVMRDRRLPRLPGGPLTTHSLTRAEDEMPVLGTLAATADWTVLIAPELDGILLERARLIEQAGGRLLSPSSKVIGLCSDKRRTTDHLQSAGLPAPRSVELQRNRQTEVELPRDFPYPAVLKRIDGAGSLGMQRIDHADVRVQAPGGRWMLEEFVPGTPVGVAVLCGPHGHVALPPFVQRLDEHTFRYSGGSRLADADQQDRAARWAARTTQSLPNAAGYVGVDLILGKDPSGTEDAVIEVNPRLTTSIVGLRAIARTNLAQAMLMIAAGSPLYPEFDDAKLTFSSDGAVSIQ